VGAHAVLQPEFLLAEVIPVQLEQGLDDCQWYFLLLNQNESDLLREY
jgi:hypothetical protein